MDTIGAVREWRKWAQAGGLSENGLKSYSYWIVRFFSETLADFDSLTLQELVAWSVSLRNSSSRHAHAALTNFYKYLHAAGYVEENPTALMPFVPQTMKVADSLSEAEIDAVFKAARSFTPRWEAALQLLYYTGARGGEAVSIKKEDVRGNSIVLKDTKRKPGGMQRQRLVPLHEPGLLACQVLRGHTRNDRLIGVTRGQLWRWCKESGREAGLGDRLHPHLFRATFATRLLERGVDVRTVQELLGHSSLETTMRYVAVTDERRRQATLVL